MRRRARTLAGVRANAGLEREFFRRLMRQIDAMHASVAYWLRVKLKNNEPLIAQDARPATVMRKQMADLSKRWEKGFEELAPEMAKWFSQDVADRSDAAFRASLKKAGFTVDFRMTPVMQDAMIATIDEQVGLINSIADDYLGEVRGMVMRSVTEGRNIGWLAKELAERYDITANRARLIARDQNSKATAVFTRARQQELGITRARWVHSHAGKKPRPEHVAFSNGTHGPPAAGPIYDVAKGAFLEGVWTWPGREINCRCFSRPIVEVLEE